MIHRTTPDQHFLQHGPARRAWHDVICHQEYRCPYRADTDEAREYVHEFHRAARELDIATREPAP